MEFEIHAGTTSYIDCPVSVNISSLFAEYPELTDDVIVQKLILEERAGTSVNTIPFQLEKGEHSVLWFIAEGRFLSGSTRSYRLKLSDNKRAKAKVEYSLTEDEIMFSSENRQLLGYRRSELLPPAGIDTLYKRSAYIHPLVSPGGEVLTRVQPPDHYHHYGIWNPWTLTHINGREIDYWNLAKGEGTVKHREIVQIGEGELFGEFVAAHDYLDFGSEVAVRKTMNEEWHCKIWTKNPVGDRYIVDLTSIIENVLDDTIIFDAYRYGGGIGFRATERWKAGNCTVLTSEGADRKTADGSKARWCIVEGESGVGKGRSGILFLSHPDNREHPEPMRVWPDNVNNGEMFFEFCPIRHTNWVIVPGEKYPLKYRMIVFDGSLSPEEAEMYWNGFAYPPAT